MHILFIIHASFEAPGCINDWIENQGHTSSMVSPHRGESFPSHESYDFLILMGGPQSPTDFAAYPYLRDEITFTQEAIKRHKPVLGVCLGAQIIGESYGAKTLHSPSKEIGVFPITLTQAGLKDPIFKYFPKAMNVMHWHNDMPGVPEGAAILAESAGCPRQVVRYAKNVYGLQCHFEMTKACAERMLAHCKNDLTGAPFVQTAEDMLSQDFSSFNQKMHEILDGLASQVKQTVAEKVN